MRAFLYATGCMLTLAQGASAQDAPAPASAFTITGGAAVTSDYRFRGLSQTDKRFAVQGTATVTHSSGFYVSFWGSSIDDYITLGGGEGDAELDLIAGYSKTFDGTKVDGGILYYYYPGSGGFNTDFFEPYLNVSHTFGPIGAKVGANYGWKQHGLGALHSRDDALYAYGELSGAIPGTGVTLTGHVGHSFEKNYITFGQKYTDWSATAAYTWKAITFSASYVDTSKHRTFFSAAPSRIRDVGGSGFVGSVGVAF